MELVRTRACPLPQDSMPKHDVVVTLVFDRTNVRSGPTTVTEEYLVLCPTHNEDFVLSITYSNTMGSLISVNGSKPDDVRTVIAVDEDINEQKPRAHLILTGEREEGNNG